MSIKNLSFCIIFSFLYLCGTGARAQCISSGSRNGGLFTNNLTSGTVTWANPANASTTNNVPTTSSTALTSGLSVNTSYLYVQNFGFNLPANAIICGISVKAEHKQQGADGVNTIVKDNEVFLIKNNSITGTNHAYPWGWTNYYANIVHGGTSDTWGTSWTAADINSPNFGVAISAQLQSNCCNQSLSADMDHVSITVFYTVPLPVELFNFQLSTTDQRQILITWSTASENNSHSFIIERSIDGVNWEKVDEISAAGMSNQLINYSIVDQHPYLQTSYYRIKQTDLNGDFYYSNTQTIQLEPKDEIFMKYDPSIYSIHILGAGPGAVNISILDYSGREVKNVREANGNNELKIPVSELASGIYIIIVESENQKKTQRFHL